MCRRRVERESRSERPAAGETAFTAPPVALMAQKQRHGTRHPSLPRLACGACRIPCILGWTLEPGLPDLVSKVPSFPLRLRHLPVSCSGFCRCDLTIGCKYSRDEAIQTIVWWSVWG